MLRWLKENSVLLEKVEEMAEKELMGKIAVGEFVHRELLTFTDAVYEVIREAKKSA
jgi:hypothetical protein